MSQKPSNSSSQSFSGRQEIPAFPSDLHSKLLMSLQNQAPQINLPRPRKLSHPAPDGVDLNIPQPNKKVRADENLSNMLADSQLNLPPLTGMASRNKLSNMSLQRESISVPGLMRPGSDVQSQSSSKNQAFSNFPSMENANRSQMQFLPDANLLALSSLGLGNQGQIPLDSLVMPNDLLANANNLQREQALKNLLLMQALQNPGDLLNNRLLQAQAQQQLQMLNQSQLQAAQNMRMPMNNGINPLVMYQYLEAQKRLQNEFAALQALQAAQRLQGNEWNQQSIHRQDPIDPRRLMEAASLERQIKQQEAEAQYNERRKEELKLQQLQNEIERQKRRANESDMAQRAVKGEMTKKDVIPNFVQQQKQQIQEDRMKEKLIQNRQVNIPVQNERDFAREKVMKKDIPREEPRDSLLRNYQPVREKAQTSRESNRMAIREPVKPERVDNSQVRRSTRINQDTLFKQDFEEEKIQSTSNKKGSSSRGQPKPSSNGPLVGSTFTFRINPQEDKGESIIQPKEIFSPKFHENYLIEVHLPQERKSTNFKRTQMGIFHQAFVQGYELNEAEIDPKYVRKLKLISLADPLEEGGVEEMQILPCFDPMSMTTGDSKEIKIGGDHQVDLKNFALNAEEEKPKRHCRLVSSPKNIPNELPRNGFATARIQ